MTPNPSWLRHFKGRIARNLTIEELRNMAEHLRHCGYGYQNSNDLEDVRIGDRLTFEAYDIEAEIHRRASEQDTEAAKEMGRSVFGVGE